MTVMTPAPKTNVPNPAQLAKRFAGVTVEEQLVSTEPPTRLAFVSKTEATPVEPRVGEATLDNNGVTAYVAGSGVRVRIGTSTNGLDGLNELRKPKGLARRWPGLSPAITAFVKASS
jgi:hypothetical protein